MATEQVFAYLSFKSYKKDGCELYNGTATTPKNYRAYSLRSRLMKWARVRLSLELVLSDRYINQRYWLCILKSGCGRQLSNLFVSHYFTSNFNQHQPHSHIFPVFMSLSCIVCIAYYCGQAVRFSRYGQPFMSLCSAFLPQYS
jgi:hypothetical protein